MRNEPTSSSTSTTIPATNKIKISGPDTNIVKSQTKSIREIDHSIRSQFRIGFYESLPLLGVEDFCVSFQYEILHGLLLVCVLVHVEKVQQLAAVGDT
ncbi:hypothetical protein CEXT_385311 [Caerostris extrusa]|uniref:Uncharacterized protein n=1 Tax=Caerostris extrusa TaxID=172846 RepID=A0AAV4RMI1_CAEEX|nr:hypothetical protein CEXT_385311 [Caerostris extrusa]